MKKIPVVMLGLLACFQAPFTFAGAHVEHGGKNPNTGTACHPARIGRIKPPALTLVAPGADFSFMVFDAQSPKHIEVTAKKITVPVTMEDKGDMVVVHGKLPEALKDTAARIQVKVKGKTEKCNTEEGWLLKISP